MTEEDVPAIASSSRSTLAPPVVVNPGATQDWPSRPVGDNFFAKALANGHSITEAAPRTNGDVADQGAAELSAWGAEDPLAVDESGADAEDGEEGWDIDVEVPETADEEKDEAEVEDAVPEDNMSPGITENEIWVRNSPLAADHVAAGSFETAMQVSSLSPSLLPSRARTELTSSLSLNEPAPQPSSRRRQLRSSQTPVPLGLPLLPRLHPSQPFPATDTTPRSAEPYGSASDEQRLPRRLLLPSEHRLQRASGRLRLRQEGQVQRGFGFVPNHHSVDAVGRRVDGRSSSGGESTRLSVPFSFQARADSKVLHLF